MVEIAIIGAGAAGLVASRHLVRCGLRPCIFEKSSRMQGVGGAWNSHGMGYKMWDNLTPNLSKHTSVFPDAPWEDEAPTFPSRVDMHKYLDRYATTFLDPDCFQYGCTVTNVKRRGISASNEGDSEEVGLGFNKQIFQVEWAVDSGELKSKDFDGVIVATGFFATPFLPDGICKEETGNIIHSSEYRCPDDFVNQTVAVLGSSFSALEIAADVRKQATKVISILPRIPYVLSRYVPKLKPTSHHENDASGFVPLDLALYRRSHTAPQIPPSIRMTEDEAAKKHAFLRQLSGSRKQRQSPLGFPTDETMPPLVAISDDYLNLVIDGNIDVMKGRVAKASPSPINTNDGEEKDTFDIRLEAGDILTGVDRIIACTGYESKLDFLDQDILEKIGYDQTERRSPLSLCWDTFHPQLPGIGFVGMYKGPYFGVMDLQARLLAGLFKGDINPTEKSITEALEESQSIRDTASSSCAPQFPRYDYIGFMDAMANQLNIVPSGIYGSQGTVVSPSFYQSSAEIASKCKAAIDQEFIDGGSANMARIALSALIGKWNFRRSIKHFNAPSDSPQKVTGVIDFSHIVPRAKGEDVSDSDGKQDWNSVLYNEKGLFQVAGKELEVFRQYEYEYKDDGILEIHFIESGKRAHLFLSLQFCKQEGGYWIATNDHLCIQDLYSATFKIAFEGMSAREIIMNYRVRGPNKDYESVTHLVPH